jgi:alpha-N-dichloroacetyl-p-aminophenylserinol N-oxygenase
MAVDPMKRRRRDAMNAERLPHGPTDRERNGAPLPQAESQARALLQRFAKSWGRRARVKQPELEGEKLFDDRKADFIPELLPFREHPAFLAAPDGMRQQILSCGWLAYNEKTVDIESKIIAPACHHIISGDVPGLQDSVSRQIAGQTLVDEVYHELLVLNACLVTRARRGLEAVTVPESQLIVQMRQAQAQCSAPWQRVLVQLATAIVSEVFISDYLKVLSTEMTIQPFNRLTVDAHRRDELAHGSIFKGLAQCLYGSLKAHECAFFAEVLPKPVHWFANSELDVWQAMLRQIGFRAADTVIRDCRSANEENLARIDYSDLIALAAELGLLDVQRGVDSFAREGLVK